MPQIHHIQSEEAIKIIGDPTRLAMLRLLLSRPATISQLGEILGKHPAQIRNHILQLEKVGLVELDSVVMVKNYLEKYYRATARAFFVNLTIFAEPPQGGQLVILGSDDLALELLAAQVHQQKDAPQVCILPVGSLDGLIYLRDHYCQVSGCHLYDNEKGEYNVSYVRHLFGEEKMLLITLSHRQQGLIVREGNPLHIQSVSDLTRPEVTFINRKRGSGTRLWLDQTLRALKIEAFQINGYVHEALTHTEVAYAVSNGQADVGLGICASAVRLGLSFIPLFIERYDLVLHEDDFSSNEFLPVWKVLQDPAFHRAVEKLGGYDTSHTGERIRV